MGDGQAMREVLFEDQDLQVALVAEEQGLEVELTTTDQGPDLTTEDEVVVVVDGQALGLDLAGPHRATATIAGALGEAPAPLTLMVRVFDFFEGWELFVDDEPRL